MKFMVCGYGNPDELVYLPKIQELQVGLELQSYGLKGVQSPDVWDEKIQQHLKVIEKFNGDIAVHGPFLGIVYHYQDYFMREAVRHRMDKTFEMVKLLKPQTLILHTGYTVGVEKFNLEEIWLEDTTAFWKKEIQKYADINVHVALENLLESDPEQLIELVDQVNSDYLTLCFDIGHANIWSYLTPSDWIHKLEHRLRHVHLHDNDGETDEHIPVGSGTIDFDTFFQTLKDVNPDVTVSLEVDETKEVVVNNLIEVLQKYRQE